MLLKTNTNAKRPGMILLIVVAFLSMFLVVGTTYLLLADSIRKTSDFDLNATDKRSDFALMPDIDPRYMFNFALGQILYDVADPTAFDPTTKKILTTNSSLRGHSLARDMYGGYKVAGANDRPFQGNGKTAAELLANPDYRIKTLVTGTTVVTDPERGSRQMANAPNAPSSSWNPSYTYPDNHHFFLGGYTLDSAGNPIIKPSFNNALIDAAGIGLDVKNLEGYPGGNDSWWIDAGFPVMTTPDGRKYKALIAPLILDLDGRINLNVAGNLMQRDPTTPFFTADHASNQGWGRWEINPKKLIENYAGMVAQYSPLSPANEFLNLLSYGTNSGMPAAASIASSVNQWKTFGRLYQANYLPVNANPPPATYFASKLLHSYSQVDFNGAGDYQAMGGWGPTAKPSFVNPNGFPSFGPGFANGQANEHLLDGVTAGLNYHSRNFNPYLSQSSATGVSTVFPVSETASILRWQGKGEPFSRSQLGQLLPKSLGLDMPYANAGPGSSMDGIFRQRIRNMITTLSADLDRPAMAPIIPDTLPNAMTGTLYSNTFKMKNFLFPDRTTPVAQMGTTYYSPIPDTTTIIPNQTSPPLKFNLDRPLTAFPAVVQNGMSDQTNFINYAGPVKAQFDQAVNDRQVFAQEIYNLLRSVTGVVFYEIAATSPDPTVQGDLLEIKKTNRWFAQLAANIVDFIDEDDFNTVFRWSGDPKDYVFGVELPRVVINEVYSMAQNDSADMFMNNTKATMPTHLFTVVELMNPLPPDGNYGVGPGGHNAVLQFKDASGTEFQNYKLVFCQRGQVVGQMNALNGNYFNSTGSHDFNMNNIASDSNGMAKAILDNWTDPNNMPMPNMVPGTWYLNAGGFMVVSDDTTLRAEADPKIAVSFKTPKIKLKNIPVAQTPGINNTPEVMLQKLVYAGMPPNDLDPVTGMLANNMLPYNPYITIDVFSKGKMHDLRKYDDAAARAPDVTTSSSVGRRSPYLDSIGLDIMNYANNMYNGNNSGNQTGGMMGGAQHNMGLPNTNLLNPLPWVAHLDRRLINPIELIHVSSVKPHEFTQTAGRWNDSFNQPHVPLNNIPMKVSHPYASNWPWFDENTRLHRFLEAVGVSPLQAGEAMHGRVLGKVNVNTMHSEEVLQAVADPAIANNFTPADVTNGFNNLTAQRPIVNFGQPNNVDFSSPVSKKGFNKSLLGYQSFASTNPANAEVPFGNLLDVAGFQASGAIPAIYPRKELLTKIGKSVNTRSNVFAVWITTGYFEVTDETTQPPTLGAEIGKADGINIRHRMFAIVDRTNMVNAQLKNVALPVPTSPFQNYDFGVPGALILKSVVPPYANVTSYDGMLLTIEPNTDNEETISLRLYNNPANAADPLNGHLVGDFLKTHPRAGFTKVDIINRGNPGPWVGYDRTKDREVVPYAEIIE
ncbi:MAG: hypothetical protein RL179_102 [Planctomycetota bacterium]|jgi:hypothetical protein